MRRRACDADRRVRYIEVTRSFMQVRYAGKNISLAPCRRALASSYATCTMRMLTKRARWRISWASVGLHLLHLLPLPLLLLLLLGAKDKQSSGDFSATNAMIRNIFTDYNRLAEPIVSSHRLRITLSMLPLLLHLVQQQTYTGISSS